MQGHCDQTPFSDCYEDENWGGKSKDPTHALRISIKPNSHFTLATILCENAGAHLSFALLETV